MLGQAIRRSEKDNQSGGDPHEIWHRMSGRQMGYVGHSVNNDVNYAQSVSNRAFGANPSANADFDLAYDNITTFEQGSMGGLYVVRGGDTLQSIAAGMWGDASLWWKIAEANGLSGQATLTEGQALRVPVGVQRNENNAQTFKPYDPGEVLRPPGDTHSFAHH